MIKPEGRPMKKRAIGRTWCGLVALAIVAAAGGVAHAYTFTDLEAGSLNSGSGGGIFATDGWGGGAFQLSWDINVDATSGPLNVYQYIYTISNPLDITDPAGQLTKTLSHMLLELSADFTANDFLDGTTGLAEGPKTYDAQACGDPGSNNCLPVDLWGAKFLNGPTGAGPYSFTIITYRAPMDGSFYARDGSCSPDPCPPEDWVFAYNTGINSSEGAFIRVPDTETVTTRQIPAPGALLLLGSGVFMTAVARRLVGRVKKG